MVRPFKTLMVANRGEIAIRIFQAATELGLRTVAIYSHEDRLSIHRYKADEAWQVGPPGEPLRAYLDIEAILEVARSRKVDAIHPGYGFLAENAEFARRCAQEGIVFIGPPADVIDKLGDKVAARAIAVAAGVPVIPGTPDPVSDVEQGVAFAASVGYPVMIKAMFGGGGRGMRRADSEPELREAYFGAQREARAAFGRGDLFIEKFLERPRHIEVQVLADRAGDIIHLFERDCSIQRRHQKVVEVAPAVGLSDDLRRDLYAAALDVARAAGLVNAATVEFLLAQDGSFFFIEVNPRIQVEHTITELITGVDIVHAQIRIAEGYPLGHPLIGIASQDAVTRRGSAIQARITTEDPNNHFAPDTGRVTAFRTAGGFGIRLDTSIGGQGAVILPFYDSLLVKACALGLTHEEAARKLARCLKEFRIRGVATNIPFLDNIVEHPAFLAGTIDTEFINREHALFEFPRRRNRASRILHALADTVVNGPAGSDAPLLRPTITMEPLLPPRLPQPTSTTRSPKQILDQDGPVALAHWVRDQSHLLYTDTTFRDAHQSLLATRVRTHDMARVAAATEQRLAGAFSVECWGGATFDVAFRFLREDPWQRLAILRAEMPDSLLQMLLRGSNAVGYTNYPENVVRTFVQLAASTGVDVFRIFDCFNQLDAMRTSIDEVRKCGKIAEVSICFTSDLHDPSRPLYHLDYYRRKARECAEAGAHIIAIKDMAGLLRPCQAGELVQALRDEVDLPLHLHTHDTSGNGIATLLAAAEAGVDIVDAAIASMSGLTSQPSLNALVEALAGTPRQPDVDTMRLQELSDYWEGVRTWYAPFESGLRASTTDVYRHEIPGGQYSNLKPQALAVGLAEQWGEIRERYREVNFAFGDVIKVTPSSKVVGDFALWLVRNDLTVAELMASDQAWDFPQSVIDFFNGSIGIPEGGFPDDIRRRILGNDTAAPTGPASHDLPDYDFDAARATLAQITSLPITDTLVISYALYPKVIKDFLAYTRSHGNISVLNTETFLYGLDADREVFIDIEPGKSLIVKRTAVGELRADNTREVHFLLNGQPRSAVAEDRSVATTMPSRRKADPLTTGHIGAPMPGALLSVAVSVGAAVNEGDALCVLEAMKLETTVRASASGVVLEVLAGVGDRLEVNDLLFVLGEAAAGAA